MDRLRIIFMGSAALAGAGLEALHRAPFADLVAVVTQPDKPKGRELRPGPTPLGERAAALALPLHKPPRARDPAFLELVRSVRPDLIVVVAYGQLLPQTLLDIPRHGCLNVHTSILPKYRGAAPIQWAIVNGERETGVSLMKMDAGLDTGPVVAESRTPIRDEDDAQTLHDRLAVLGAELLVRIIPDYVAGRIHPVPQPAEGATYARKITKDDGRIDWSRPARAVFNQVRGFNPWPGAFSHTELGGRRRMVKIWRAEAVSGRGGPPGSVTAASPDEMVVACGDGALRILELQMEGSRRMPCREFQLGHPMPAGRVFV